MNVEVWGLPSTHSISGDGGLGSYKFNKYPRSIPSVGFLTLLTPGWGEFQRQATQGSLSLPKHLSFIP